MVIRPVESAPVQTLSSLDESRPLQLSSSTSEASPVESFGAVLGSAIDQANRLDFNASQKVEALAAGTIDDLHGTMIATKEADIALKLVGTVRSKILDAFQELWRTSV
jgi:flagellar hook-basal body complex protein FliE